MCSHSRRLSGGAAKTGAESFARGVAAAAHRLHDLIGVDRLGEIVPRAALDRLDRGRDRRVAGQEQDAQLRIELQQLRDQRKAVVLAELQIEHDVSGRCCARSRQRVGAIAGRSDIETARTERAREHAHEDFVVVDQEDALCNFALTHRMLRVSIAWRRLSPTSAARR